MRSGLILGLLSIAFVATCASPRRVEAPPAVELAPLPLPELQIPSGAVDDAARDRAVVLVVLDGARWQEVYGGVDPKLAAGAHVRLDATPMPRLRASVAARGVAIGAPGHGAIVRASGPNFVSLPGYTELFTGRTPTSCGDNYCGRTPVPTVADELGAHADSPGEVAVIASWPEIERAASVSPERLVLSTGRHTIYGEPILRADTEVARLLDQGAAADHFPGEGDFRPDGATAPIALRYLEAARPRFLFVGLGEPDEYAHRGDYAAYIASLGRADAFLDDLVSTLDRMGERGRNTTVLVTADHGRADDFRDHGGGYPESARVWLVALGRGIPTRGFLDGAEERRLADVAPTIRASLGLPEDDTPEAGRAIAELLPRGPLGALPQP